MVNRPEPMPSQTEEVLNDSVNVQESLTLGGRLEAPPLAFGLSGWLTQYLGSMVRKSGRFVSYQRHEVSVSRAVTALLVRDEAKGFPALTLHESSKEFEE